MATAERSAAQWGDVEREIILVCAKVLRSAADDQRLTALLDREPAWDAVMEMAAIHGIRPVLYKVLNQIAPSQVPEDILRRLQAGYAHNVARNLQLVQENLRVIRLLQEVGIEALPYKGPMQASIIYGNIGLREIADLDIIVHEEAVVAAHRHLLASGYRVMGESEIPDAKALADPNRCNLELLRDDGQVKLELHWKVLADHSSNGFNRATIWDNSVLERIGDLWVHRLRLETVFFMLCLHNETHNWQILRYLRDAAALVLTRDDIEWEGVLGLGEKYRKMDSVLITCQLAKTILGVPMPELIEQRLGGNRLIQSRCGILTGTFFTHSYFTVPDFDQWRVNMRQIGGDSSSYLSQRLYYLLGLWWPEYGDKRHFTRAATRSVFVQVGVRALRFTKWNLLPWNREVKQKKALRASHDR